MASHIVDLILGLFVDLLSIFSLPRRMRWLILPWITVLLAAGTVSSPASLHPPSNSGCSRCMYHPVGVEGVPRRVGRGIVSLRGGVSGDLKAAREDWTSVTPQGKKEFALLAGELHRWLSQGGVALANATRPQILEALHRTRAAKLEEKAPSHKGRHPLGYLTTCQPSPLALP